MSMNLTNYRQSERLRALGMPQDGHKYHTWVWAFSDFDTEKKWGPELLLKSDYAGPEATDVHSAIMWLLQSERGRELWGDDVGVFSREGYCDLRLSHGAPWGCDADTLSGLLNAMLDAMEAKDA